MFPDVTKSTEKSITHLVAINYFAAAPHMRPYTLMPEPQDFYSSVYTSGRRLPKYNVVKGQTSDYSVNELHFAV